jgi:thiol-disulfide isomerase/thioredoxin
MTCTTTTLVYIGASWCAPCKTVKPLAEVLAHKFGVPITFLDYDEMEEAEKDDVKKLPTIRILQDDTVVQTIITAHADMLEMWLRANVRVNATEDF